MFIKKLLIISLQSLFLCGGHTFLKLALASKQEFSLSMAFFKSVCSNWRFMVSGISFFSAGMMWVYILKVFPFHQSIPMSALVYVFSLIASLLVFGETVPLVRWIGMSLILAGCLLIMS